MIPSIKKYIPYPSLIHNPEFNDIIGCKYEFNRFFTGNTQPKRNSNKGQACKSTASTTATTTATTTAIATFNLKPYQRMLSAYMSPKTPYSSLLLFHATGTGKTCTAITIARQFTNTFSKPPLVIFPSTLLESNFQKEVQWCGDKSEDEAMGWEFRGAIEFANIVKKIEDEAGSNKVLLNEMLKDAFSNRVIIVDEAHNLRSNETDKKQVPPKLMRVLRIAQNIKLILMTATPMFDSAREIVFLLNLLMANDNRPEIREGDIFDSSDNVKPNAIQMLANAAYGYVSFQQTSNATDGMFPTKLDPPRELTMASKSAPKIDIYGDEIPAKDRLKPDKLKQIVMSPMHGKQLFTYQNILKRMMANRDDRDDDEKLKAYVSESNPSNNVYARLRMVSNIVFPAPGIDVASSATAFKYVTGIMGFNRCFLETNNGSYAYRSNVPEFLGPSLLGEHSSKIDQIIKAIKKCKGVVLVHSSFVVCGLLPIALALEHIGFVRYGGSPLLKKSPNAKKTGHSYVIWTGQAKLSPNKDEEIKIAKLPTNAHGDVIKVILASDVATEGIDLKCIRQVHILDPWYNHSKMQQVFGRAIRHCSHASLPASMRDVSIYQHAVLGDIKDKESVDLRTYRMAFIKQKKIDNVADILKAHAIESKMSNNRTERSTFDIYFAKPDIDENSIRIRECFEYSIALTFQQILNKCMPIDEEIFIWSLQNVLDDPSPSSVYSKLSKQWGRIVYISNKYIFQPSTSTDPRLSLGEREGKSSLSTVLQRAQIQHHLFATNSSQNNQNNASFEALEARAKRLITTIGCNRKAYLDVALEYMIDRLTCSEQLRFASAHPGHPLIQNLPNVFGESQSTFFVDFTSSSPGERYLKWRASKNAYEPSTLDERTIKQAERDVQRRVAYQLNNIEAFVTFDDKHTFKMVSSRRHRDGGILTGTGCLTTSTIKKQALHQHITVYDADAASKLNPVKSGKGEYCDMYELVLRKHAPHLLLRPYEYHLAMLHSKKST